MKRLLPLLLLPLLLAADPVVKLPDSVKGEAGDFIKVSAVTDCKAVRWLAIDKGLNLFPVELLKDSKTAIVIGKADGSYRLLAYTALADVPSDPAVCVVIVGTPAPPAPPTPPMPPVPPPEPSDLARNIEMQWSSDKGSDPDAVSNVVLLAALYRVGATTTVNDPTLASTGDLLARMQAGRKSLMPDSALPRIRRVIADELNKTLATPATLDAAKRAEIAADFVRVAVALDALK